MKRPPPGKVMDYRCPACNYRKPPETWNGITGCFGCGAHRCDECMMSFPRVGLEVRTIAVFDIKNRRAWHRDCVPKRAALYTAGDILGRRI